MRLMVFLGMNIYNISYAVMFLHKFDMDSIFAIHYDGRWIHAHKID